MKDQIIRKLWLTLLLFSSVSSAILHPEKLPEWNDYLGWFEWTGITFVLFYIFYYCAYKHPGTRLLTFSLLLKAIKCVMILFTSVIWKLNQIPLHDYSYWTITLTSLALDLCWWFLCLKMLTLNDRIRESKKAA